MKAKTTSNQITIHLSWNRSKQLLDLRQEDFVKKNIKIEVHGYKSSQTAILEYKSYKGRQRADNHLNNCL